jgi:ATP-dependent DNA helicase RecG
MAAAMGALALDAAGLKGGGMRPALLDPLFAPLSTLAGVGPKNARLFDRLFGRTDGARVLDLLFHLPFNVLDRRSRPKIRDATPDAIATLRVRVVEHRAPAPNRKGPFRVLVEDDTGDVELVFFLNNFEWVKGKLPVGAQRWVSGRLELFDGHLQMIHPDKVMDDAEFERMPAVEPVYSLTEGLYPRNVQKAALAAMGKLPALPEWLDASALARFEGLSFAAALKRLHLPENPGDVEPTSAAFRRLAYDELLAGQLALLMVRSRMRELAGRAQVSEGRLAGLVLAALPYGLTGAQARAVGEIRADLALPKRMIRLLQGDVGAGKTVVALLAMCDAVEAGRQAALMAPTEILARQHCERLAALAAAAGLRLELFTGRDAPAQRRDKLARLAAGEIDIAVGTHALFQESVALRDLGLAVVDEQHRFGVHQRLALSAKGEAADLLVMTATPIPRSLVLTYFGDMDVSVLDEKPPGRSPIDTRAIPLERLEDVVAGIGRALAGGARAYWVCPLVEENEELDVAAAEARAEALREFFGPAVGLIHGKMKGPDKDAAMERFQRGETQVLVATTVIEVGVDVPEATVMVIEHAERFGLAQLHQLRGRVGRGAGRSTCLLLYKGPLGETARARLEILRETEDGFRIAEEDLRLRGEGDVLGAKQSGAPGFRLARIEVHGELLRAARVSAEAVVAADEGLSAPEHRALRLLLWLFERDAAVKLLEAG